MAQCGGESSRRNEFPIGMRVLAVDDDRVCLRLLEAQLKGCGYQVTATQHAFTALKILRENKDNYDLVISDVQMPDMDGFKLLEIIGLEMDLPVIMLSVNSETGYVMKGVLHGAVDYLVKPVMLEDLKLIWKHVIKKSLLDKKGSNDPSNNYIQEKKADNDQYLRPARKCMDQIKEKEDYAHENSDGELSKQKRPRVSWSTDLHTRFIKAVDQLGFDRAVPKRILDLMNVQGLTRENVASHLQKYRKTLKENGIGLNQKAHDGSHLHGFSVDSPNSIILSFNHQAHSKVHPPEEYRLHEHKKNSMMVSPGPFQDSHRGALPSPFLPFSSLRSQAGHLRTEHVEFSSNSLGMERAYPCSGFNNFSHQFLTTTLDQIDDYTQNFSQKPWVSVGNPDSLSSSQVQCPSNQDSFETLFESNNSRFNDSAELNSVLPSDLDMASVSGDMLDMQRYGGETFKYTYHSESESTEHQPEDSPMETLFHLNKYHSADDLNTVLKQFQQ